MPERNINWLKENYFSDPRRRLRLQRGDKLLVPGQENRRLYLVISGSLRGYITDEGGREYEIFLSGPKKLVAAYSFFSVSHRSYSTVEATEPTEVAFIEATDLEDKDYLEFALHILPAVVEEIYTRQLEVHRMNIQAQEYILKLKEAEKLAALGQMAAGLAHELNNAVGVIEKSTGFLVERVSEFLQEKDSHNRSRFFRKGLEKGQPRSSSEIRKRRRELEALFGFKPALARQLARIGLTDAEIRDFGDEIEFQASRINYYFETGVALHDLSLASGNASRTVASVRELGASGRIRISPVDLNATIRQSVSLLRDQLQGISLELELQPLPTLLANENDWVEVWTNLIKNAAEALGSQDNPRPVIKIHSRADDGLIRVRVSDNGPGIPAALQGKVFQPNVTTKKEGLSFGLGLGLSIVERIVSNYQGNIRLESEPGKTEFYLHIPIA